MTDEAPTAPPPSEPPARPPPAGPRTAPSDRRALYGALIFGGLILVCFAFALLLMSSDRRTPVGDGPRIGVVEVEGTIVAARSWIETLRAFRADETIRAVVVRINSPGGAVGASQEVYREIQRVREKKPVVASLETVAASGGYYVAAAAQKIVANAGTITGSIGVITTTANVQELLQAAHIKTETIKTGRFKDTLSPLRSLSDDERAYLQSLLDNILAQFVADVAQGRKLDKAKVQRVADGRVFTGAKAKDLGLVDQIGNFSDALKTAAKLAKAEGEPVAIYRERRRGLLQELLQDAVGQLRAALGDALRNERRIEVRDEHL